MSVKFGGLYRISVATMGDGNLRYVIEEAKTGTINKGNPGKVNLDNDFYWKDVVQDGVTHYEDPSSAENVIKDLLSRKEISRKVYQT